MEGTRESHPRVHDLQHPRLGKPRRGLQIMDTRMGFPCPFHSVVIDSIILGLNPRRPHRGNPVGEYVLFKFSFDLGNYR